MRSGGPGGGWGRGGRRANLRKKQGKFEIDSPKVVHKKLGVWDLYEEVNPVMARVPGSSRVKLYLEMYESLPWVWQMIKDVASIRSCWHLLAIYLSLEFIGALLPAVSLWYSGKMIDIVQSAVTERSVNTNLLFEVAAARFACSVAERLIGHAKNRVSVPINTRIKLYYSSMIFEANARLDCPTFNDPQVQQQLDQAMPRTSQRASVAWDSLWTMINIGATVVQILSRFSVLVRVLREQRDGPLIAGLSLVHSVFRGLSGRRGMEALMGVGGAWAATATDPNYVRMEGLKKTVLNSDHRQEIVAGGDMWRFMLAEYSRMVDIVGEKANDFGTTFQRYKRQRLSLSSFLSDPLREMPQIVFTLRAVQYPSSIPVSLASLNLITQTTERFSFEIFRLFDETGNIADSFINVRKLYELTSIPNKLPDGHVSFPENQQTIKAGFSVEFRNVTFQYPNTTHPALKDVSFKIDAGQLCVIVGNNGSGKSTILKLITRIFDPQEGEILIDGIDIKTLRLNDLRRATSVLFQDYTHFSLDIKDNIGLGDPENAHDIDRIHEAARLGGAEEFIDRLPEGFDTYLSRPVPDHYSRNFPEGSSDLFNTRRAGLSDTSSTSLSGGQMQRIALSRSFMRSLVSEPSHAVGLLLFDEPSASLDVPSEYDLFQRLRQLRGDKTMIFSSHRFGNLTRHADVIIYMDDSRIIEIGTHEELIEKDGEYAKIWKMSAQAFL